MRPRGPELFCALLYATTLLAESPQPGISVCIDRAAAVKFEILAGAKRTAVQLFEGIGVRLRFVCDRTPDASNREIVMRIADRTDPGFLRRALGFARPYARSGVRVTIFYDRVEEVQRGRDDAGVILGHTMTHELTHVLEAEDAHADNGIMRSRWDERDFEAMRVGELYFSEADVRAIHGNLGAFTLPDTSHCMRAAAECSPAGN